MGGVSDTTDGENAGVALADACEAEFQTVRTVLCDLLLTSFWMRHTVLTTMYKCLMPVLALTPLLRCLKRKTRRWNRKKFVSEL